MFDDINNLIIVEKNRLRKKSRDFIKNFKKIERYIVKVFFWLSSRRRIDFVLTCGYLYVQNRLIDSCKVFE